MAKILVVDDEIGVRRTLRELLEFEGYKIEEAEDGVKALDKMRSQKYDLVLLDIKMPKKDGMVVLEEIVKEKPELPIIMLTAYGTLELAVEATKLGAFNFIGKPPDLNRMMVTIRNALSLGTLETENRRMRKALEQYKSEITPMLGESSTMTRIKQTIKRVASSNARVLITGEAGTGKELVAKWIHQLSKRSDGPFVAINCAAIPSELIESQLFGHETGAFTGAAKQRIGRFEQADGGTLFLDEIGDMSLQAQAKVLRTLQENVISRVGGDKNIMVDVRVVAATNQDLLAMVDQNTFREDLYHRLSVIPIHVPPLRDRRDDIPLIARHFCESLCRTNGLPDKYFSEKALDILKRHEWRGNVRELHNAVERLIVLSEESEISATDVELFVLDDGAQDYIVRNLVDQTDQMMEFRELAEEVFIRRKLEKFSWNVTATAKKIGIQRSYLYTKMKQFNICRDH